MSHFWPTTSPGYSSVSPTATSSHDLIFSSTKSMRCSCKKCPFSCGFTLLLAHFRGTPASCSLLFAHCLLHTQERGGRERPLTCGAGTEPMGRLQVLNASRVLAGNVDGGGLRCRRVKPGLTGGLVVRGENLGEQSSLLSPQGVLWGGARAGLGLTCLVGVRLARALRLVVSVMSMVCGSRPVWVYWATSGLWL